MSHITVIINRVQPSQTSGSAGSSLGLVGSSAEQQPGVNYATVTYTPEDSMTEEQVAHALKKLYKAVKDLGT